MKNWKRIIATAAITLGTVAGAGAVPGMAGIAAAGECSARSTKQAFLQWGDANQYFIVNNGTFESGTGGWTLAGGPRVVSGQAPWKVNGSTHSKALQLPAGSSATAPFMCVASNEEWMRFFYRDPGVPGASIRIEITVKNSTGAYSVNTWEAGSSSAGWKVSSQIGLPNLRDANGEQWISMRFIPTNTPATWQIADVMVDPWVSR